MKFDPNTGQPLMKFDPNTGQPLLSAVGQRALDAALEDGGMRNSIKGLFAPNAPVPSLQNALYELAKKYPHLSPTSDDVEKARRKVKTIEPKDRGPMSDDEAAAVVLYTMEAIPREQSLYYLMNAALRSMDRGGVREWRDFIWLLLNGMRKIPSNGERSVYRGIKNTSKKTHVGHQETWSAFSSTATTMDVMSTFIGPEGERIMYDIELTEPIARDVRAFSLFPSENELLLPPNFSFEIVSTFPAGHGLTLVQCKQTKTLDQLIDFGAAPSNWSTPMRVPQQQMMDRGMPGMPPMAQAQSNPDMQMQMMQQQMMQMQQMQMQQMQMQQQQPMQQPNANLNFPGKIETSEIKGCACHVCPAPPLAWWAIGCYEPKGPDRIGSWFQVAAVHPGVPWLPICEEHQRVPGTNTFTSGDSKLHLSKQANGKIGVSEENPCVWGNKFFEIG